jgi:hypothetical protein
MRRRIVELCDRYLIYHDDEDQRYRIKHKIDYRRVHAYFKLGYLRNDHSYICAGL